MRVHIDDLVCEANAICVSLDPEVFRLDEELDVAIADPEVPLGHEATVLAAVQACPKQALRASGAPRTI